MGDAPHRGRGLARRGELVPSCAAVRARPAAFAEVAIAVVGLAQLACAEQAVVVEVRAEGLVVPGDVDALCLGVGDSDESGGEFARRYRIGEGGLDGLPQTLTVEPGEASTAFAWARGSWRGIEVARDAARFEFGVDEVVLTLAACPGGPGGAPAQIDRASVPPGSRLALSLGRTGSELLAVGEGGAALLEAGAGLETRGGQLPDPGEGAPLDLVPFDADGDCDDDALVVLADGATALWRREADGSFVAADGGPDEQGAAAAAAADVDEDGDLDLAVGGPGGLTVWLNDGAGRFARHPNDVAGDGATDVVRLAFGDFDGDGAIDLVAGRGGAEAAPPRVLFNDGSGGFSTAPAALPELPRRIRALAVADVDGDGVTDLVAAGLDMPITLYVSRGDGRLEDRSFVSLPAVDPVDVTSLAAADWDGDCLADLIVGLADGGALSWRGDAAGRMVDDGSPAAAGSIVLLGDADDDGDRDLLAADGDELGWAGR